MGKIGEVYLYKQTGHPVVVSAHTDLLAHLLDLRDLLRVALGDVVAAEDDDVALEEHAYMTSTVQWDGGGGPTNRCSNEGCVSFVL